MKTNYLLSFVGQFHTHILALICGLLAILCPRADAQSGNFTDLFPGSSLSSSWSSHDYVGTSPGGGSTGSSTAVGSNTLQLKPSTGANNTRWILANAVNYSHLGTSETFSTTLNSLTCGSSPGSGAAFSIVLIANGSSPNSAAALEDDTSAAHLLEFRFLATSSTTGTVAFRAKDASIQYPDTIAAFGGATPTTFTLGSATTMGFTITNNEGSSNVSTVTMFVGTQTYSCVLPAKYNTNFSGTGNNVYLYLIAENGSSGTQNIATVSQCSVCDFSDNFAGTTLNANNWSSTEGGDSGYSIGVKGSATGGDLGLTTAATNAAEAWVYSSASNFSFIGKTETFSADMGQLAAAASPNNGSSFNIVLIGGTNPTGVTHPVSSATNVIELSVVGNSSGYATVTLNGRIGGTGWPSLIGTFNDILPGNGGLGNVGMTITNSGVSNSSTVTVFCGDYSQDFTLPSTYSSPFNGPVWVYLLGANGASATASSYHSFFKFSVASQPSIATDTLVASVAVDTNANAKQTIAGHGGDYAVNRTSGTTYADDTNGIDNLAYLQPTYARVGVPLTIWEPNDLTESPIPSPFTGFPYSSTDSTTHYYTGGNMANVFGLINALLDGGVTHFVFSVWTPPSWMLTSNGRGDGGTYIGNNNDILQSLAAFLLEAEAQSSGRGSGHPALNLADCYLSLNETDVGPTIQNTPAQYAAIVTSTSSVFTACGITTTIPWLVGDTETAVSFGGTYPVGSAQFSGYSGSFTDGVLSAICTTSGSGHSIPEVGGRCIADISYHSWDFDLNPSILQNISLMGAYYGGTYGSVPILCTEVGYSYDQQFDGTNGSEYSAEICNTWDNAWKVANAYQKVVNFSGAVAPIYWEYMNDTALRSGTGTPYPAYYTVKQIVYGFPAGTTILDTAVQGNIEAMAGTTSTSSPYTTQVVQIIQNDQRAVTVNITGLTPSHTYTLAQSCYNATTANTYTSSPSWGTSITADANGEASLAIPAITTIEMAPYGTSSHNDASGSVVTLQY